MTTIFAPRSMHSMNQCESVSLFSTRFLPSMMRSFEKRRSLKSQSDVCRPWTHGWPGARILGPDAADLSVEEGERVVEAVHAVLADDAEEAHTAPHLDRAGAGA